MLVGDMPSYPDNIPRLSAHFFVVVPSIGCVNSRSGIFPTNQGRILTGNRQRIFGLL